MVYLRDIEQGQETTGVNNCGGVSSAKMDEDSDEEKEDERVSDNENREEYEEEDSYFTMGDKSRSSSENSGEYTEEANSKPIVVQQEYKIQVKFETKMVGMKVAKGNNKLWVVKINTEKVKRKIQV